MNMQEIFFQQMRMQQPKQAFTVTRFLCYALLLFSIIAAVLERYGYVSRELFRYTPSALLNGETWRFLTYFFLESSPLSVVLALLGLWFMANWAEQSLGTKNFITFCVMTILGSAFLALPLSYALHFVMPFTDTVAIEGTSVLSNAILVALAYRLPQGNVMFGFVLPIAPRQLVYFMLGIDVLSGFMTGAAHLSITLSSMLMGYLCMLWFSSSKPQKTNTYTTRTKASHLRVIDMDKLS